LKKTPRLVNQMSGRNAVKQLFPQKNDESEKTESALSENRIEELLLSENTEV
jgi:hypothetical protein